MRLSRYLCFVLIGLASCKTPKEQPPVPFRKMQDVMLDIHLAETYSQGLGDTTGNKFEKNYDSLAVFYSSVLKHHGLSFEEFNEALEWFRERPLQMDSLYTGIIERLNTLKAKEGIRDIEDPANVPVPAPAERANPDALPGTKDSTLKRNLQKADTLKIKELRKKPTTQAEP